MTGTRLNSLDVFRGITIAGMILVNNQGDWSSVYSFLRHAAWHGWSGADLVFPFFLFIVGMSLSFSLSSRLSGDRSMIPIFLKIITRTTLLLLLGFLLNLAPEFDFTAVRIPGVLQRIALCYFSSSLIYIFFRGRARLALILLILTVYWILLEYVSPDGSGRGSLEPGNNLCGYIDSRLFPGHTYRHAPAPGFDPEGLLSTVPALATALMGTLAGDFMRGPAGAIRKITVLFAASAILTSAGLFMNIFLPINKNLWTSSFAVFTAGITLFVFMICYLLADVKRIIRPLIPFTALGINAITAYILSTGIAKMTLVISIIPKDGSSLPLKTYIFNCVFRSWLDPFTASLAYAVSYLCIWIMLMYILYHKKFFIKI